MPAEPCRLNWRWKTFAELEREELYACLRLRQQVFVVEQGCAFLDADGLDGEARHLLGVDGAGELCAYLRVLAPGRVYREIAIGRVVTAPQIRGRGLGRELFARGLRLARRCFPGHGVRIGAQQRLVPFYREAGFVTAGEPYLEDGIRHVEMLLSR